MLDRRNFISVLIAGGASIVLPACGKQSNYNGDTPLQVSESVPPAKQNVPSGLAQPVDSKANQPKLSSDSDVTHADSIRSGQPTNSQDGVILLPFEMDRINSIRDVDGNSERADKLENLIRLIASKFNDGQSTSDFTKDELAAYTKPYNLNSLIKESVSYGSTRSNYTTFLKNGNDIDEIKNQLINDLNMLDNLLN